MNYIWNIHFVLSRGIECFLFLFIFLPAQSNAQITHGLRLQTGISRIGVHTEAAYTISRGRYQFSPGIRIYPLNLVFEKNNPAIVMTNGWHWRPSDRRIKLGVTFSSAFTTERKTTLRLFLADFMLQTFFHRDIGKNFGWYIQPGIGFVCNLSRADIELTDNSYAYLNYELSTGFTYRFSSVTDD